MVKKKAKEVARSSTNKKNNVKRLYRSKRDKVFGGVCAGIAKYFEVDSIAVKLIWIIATLISVGFGVLAYLIAWLIIPLEQ